MITNATLISAVAAPTPDGKGSTAAIDAVSIGVRVCFGEPRMSQRMTLQGRIADATGVVYAPRSLAAWPTFAPRQRLTVQLDGGATQTLQVVEVIDRAHDAGESHWEIYVRAE